MTQYEYKCVPAPKKLTISSTQSESVAIQEFADYINQNCDSGWEFCSMGQISVTSEPEPPGCIPGLLMALGWIPRPLATTTSFNMLVFRRQK